MDPCKQEDIGVNECMITNPPFWTSKVLVNITEINPLGSNSTIIQIDVHELCEFAFILLASSLNPFMYSDLRYKRNVFTHVHFLTSTSIEDC